MKRFSLSLLLSVLLVVSAFGQSSNDVTATQTVEPSSITLGESVVVTLTILNSSSQERTVREVDLYFSTNGSVCGGFYGLDASKVKVPAQGSVTFQVPFTPPCAAVWSAQGYLRFGGSAMTTIVVISSFTVN